LVKNSGKTFICGWPVAHSRSPLIHNFWLQIHGISGAYEKVAVEPGQMQSLTDRTRSGEYLGGNITIPHKEAVLQLLDHVSPSARKIGAVNTLWMEANKLCGDNTDWIGFLANLDQIIPRWDKRETLKMPTMVIGAGGAARAIIYALQQRGFENIRLANRTIDKAKKLATEFGSAIEAVSLEYAAKKFHDTQLLVNTSSLGMHGQPDFNSVFLEAMINLPKTAIVNDLVYTPLETSLLSKARHVGLITADGLGMLLHQAVPGFEHWYGKRPIVNDALRALVLKDLGAKAQ
jgi:shikimate dehydrogenase